MKQNGGRLGVFFFSFRFIIVSKGDVPGGTGATAMTSPHTTEDAAAAVEASQASRDMAPSSVVGKAQSSTAEELHPASPCQHHPPTALQGVTDVAVMDLL